MLAPLAESVNDVPGQKVDPDVGVTAVVGTGFIVTGTPSEEVHPVFAASVRVAV